MRPYKTVIHRPVPHQERASSMSDWLARHGLKLTRRGERVQTALTGLALGGGVTAAFILDAIIRTNI